MQRLEIIRVNLNLPASSARLNARITEFKLADNPELGTGKTSESILVNYLGSNPDILKFGNPLALKRGKLIKNRQGLTQHSLFYEVENIDALNERHPSQQLKHVVIGATLDLLGNDGLETAIISPLIAYSPDEEPKNAYQYVNVAVLNSHVQFRHFQLARSLNDFANSIQTALQELHGLGYLHLDGALRNYMVSEVKGEEKGRFFLKLIDLGLSRPIANEAGFSALLPVDQPLRILNQSALYAENNKRYVSILTDLFQMRCIMLELAGTAMGLNHNEILGLKDDAGKEIPFAEYQQARRQFASDDALLKYLTDNLIEYLRKQEKRDSKAAPILHWLQAYYPFITQLPACTPQEELTLSGALSIAQRDRSVFSQCAKAFETTIQLLENKFLPALSAPIARQASLGQLPSSATAEDEGYADVDNTAVRSANPLAGHEKLFSRCKSFSELGKYQNLLETVQGVLDSVRQAADFQQGAGFNRIDQELKAIDVSRLNQSQCKLLWEKLLKIAGEQVRKLHVNENLRQFYQFIQDENTYGLKAMKAEMDKKFNNHFR